MVEDERKVSLFRRTGFLFTGLGLLFLVLFTVLIVSDSVTFLHQAPKTEYFLILGVSVVLFMVSALIPRLYWIQPILLLAAMPIPLMSHASSMFSLGLFLAAEMLLTRMGFFKKARIPKYLLSIFYFFLCEILIGGYKGSNGLEIAAPIVFTTTALGFLALVYGDNWKVFLIEGKPSLSLAELKLSPMETEYLKAIITGHSIKEIAIDRKVKESTVRNTLVRVYRKFDVQDKASLMAKCEKYHLVD